MHKTSRGPNRRQFLCGCSAAVAALAGSRFNSLAFGMPGAQTDTLIVVFLRGGMDGLSLLPPISGSDRGHYEAARPGLAVPTSGPDRALPFDAQFGVHPSAAPLRTLYQDGGLAVVQAAGMAEVNRSHFDAMNVIEIGVGSQPNGTSGWLARHLASSPTLPSGAEMPSLSIGDLQPVSLLSSYETVNVADPNSFNINFGPWNWIDEQKIALQTMWNNDVSWLHTSGVQAFNAMDLIESNFDDSYTPANGAVYPDSDFGDQLQVVAQMIKLDIGLQVATIDFGGWDTHEGQGVAPGGYLSGLFDDLSRGLAALYADLDVGTGSGNFLNRTTVTVQSEFGRELRENSDAGTEHGYGNFMLVLGGSVNGGQLYGSWPGLSSGQLFDGTDVDVTTDYRQVLSEILERRLGNPNLGQVFPGFSPGQHLGIVGGSAPPLFRDGFESGSLGDWSGHQT